MTPAKASATAGRPPVAGRSDRRSPMVAGYGRGSRPCLSPASALS